MARPKFHVQHFVACLSVSWDGTPGPNTPRTLEGVCHSYGVPPDVELPVIFEVLWLFARLFRTNQKDGSRDFSVAVIWLDNPTGPRLVTRRPLGQVRLSTAHPIADVAWALRGLRLPGFGRYEFRLRCATRTRIRSGHLIVAREYIRIERQP